jgi:hypothetical protein
MTKLPSDRDKIIHNKIATTGGDREDYQDTGPSPSRVGYILNLSCSRPRKKMTRHKKIVEYIIIGGLIVATAIAIGIATQSLF